MYVDDIIVIGDDYSELEQLKWYLVREFELKVLGSLKYFFFLGWTWSEAVVVL